MDDSDYVCPLCCEELDISDREFYPCKCGYQVCVFCWHKIRNTENGLCPACRTAYGEDPHQFTALDVEEVLKAKKEAQVAAKRERHLQSQLQHQASLSMAAAGSTVTAAASIANDTAVTTNTDTGADSTFLLDLVPPKDRSQLANLRVIRRNLIYVVGLPPSIANEEMLRRPEYFGQYGKLAKVVFNRSQVTPGDGGDPRRASSSAYITFQYKEDTLACILALDGFYIDNRTIRASYGTSKYCSAFIKHVRCSNPECTYLHEMGAAEDTFTKQEIQAGYVTSGRDVLARQQQILQEQMKQLSASASTGQQPPRKRVGGGGPSGTGKASANPIFPAPEYDEPMKPSPPSLPSAVAILKASSIGNPLSSTAMQSSFMNAGNIPAKLGRASSVGISGSASAINAANPTRKPHAMAPGTGAVPTTAASVVAGGRVASKDTSDGANVHSALTALTPLKRSSAKGGPVVASTKMPPVVTEEKAPGLRNGKKQNGAARANVPSAGKLSTAGSDTTTPTSLSTLEDSSELLQSGAIGGDIIGLPLRTTMGDSAIGRPVSTRSNFGSLAELGGTPIAIHGAGSTANRETDGTASTVVGGSSLLGGSLLVPSSNNGFSHSAIRNDIGLGFASSSNVSSNSGVIGSHISNQYGNSSSALASILGINLPTGSGSLQETSSLWSPAPSQQFQGPSPLSMLNDSSMQDNPYYSQQGAMGMQLRTVGPPQPTTRSSQIGGVPIRSTSASGVVGLGPMGGFAPSSNVGGGGSGQSDIALLQSLLPGVHITTDRSNSSLGWGAVSHGPGQEGSAVGGNAGIVGGGSWVGASEANNSMFSSSVGRTTLGGNSVGQNHTQQQSPNKGSGIW